MKAFAKAALLTFALTLTFGVARADNDGFTPPQAAPTEHVATSNLPATDGSTPSGLRSWSPDRDAPQQAAPQPRYATQGSSPSYAPLSQSAAPAAPQSRYASQLPQSEPVLSQPAPAAPPATAPSPRRYATQTRPRDVGSPRGNDFDYGYHLGAGDKIRLIVYGEDDLGGEFEVDGTGFVRLPLIGQVQAAGLTVHDFEQMVANQLADGYLRDPHISAEVTTYRPFYIIGEVNKPGEYNYVNGMNVVTAVALAGGYTYRASDDAVYVRRNGSQREEELPANERTIIYPGDIIRIKERFF